jgi:UDP-N-acetyl-D-glucosamine/UDP-N-acetyl-D-galactosamine dehydrogenase
MDNIIANFKLAVIGLGYVGLPLAVEFGKKRDIIGFDINLSRINDLQKGKDVTLEISSEELSEATNLKFSSSIQEIKDSNCYIVTVPTPIDDQNQPDLSPLIKASEMIGKILNPGDIVIYESTVYPGATEEECVPILERYSGLTFNKEFFCGYSPERINPGDKMHRISNIIKVTSGSTPEIAEQIDRLYKEIITVGTYKAESIKVAEAAKVIENTQRDINIALINELSVIFQKMNIDTESVLNAAGTKWNFLPFKPGLVGGHCIGVDPYYLTYKAEKLGYKPEVILAGRKLNDGMGSYVATQLLNTMNSRNIHSHNVLIMGLSFKENCPDLRNTKVVDIIFHLEKLSPGITIDVYDPWVNSVEAGSQYNINIINSLESNKYNGVIIAVAHDVFKDKDPAAIKNLIKGDGVIYDLKSILPKQFSDLRL